MIEKVGSGWIFDRFSIRGISFFYFLLAISVLLALPVVGVASVFFFMVCRGIAHGGMIVDVPILTRHYFGMERIGMTMGVMAVCVNLGFMTGPPLLGWFADTYGNFTVGIIVFACAAGVATLSLLWVKPRYWTPPTKLDNAPAVDKQGSPQPAAAAG